MPKETGFMNRILFCFIGLLLVSSSCADWSTKTKDRIAEKNQDSTAESTEESMSPAYKATKVSKARMDQLLSDFSTDFNYEFIDLYSPTDAIPEADSLFIDDILVKKGFRVIDRGRGNWALGPRIVSLTLQKEHCLCHLNKLYYSDYDGKQHQQMLKITEQLMCKGLK